VLDGFSGQLAVRGGKAAGWAKALAPFFIFLCIEGAVAVAALFLLANSKIWKGGASLRALQENAVMATLLAANIAVLFYALPAYLKDRGEGGKAPFGIWDALALAAFGIFFHAVLRGAITVLSIAAHSSLLSPFRSRAAAEMAPLYWGAEAWLNAAATGLMAPLAEEAVFRGLLYKRVSGMAGTAAATAASSALFASVHFPSLEQMGYAFAMGAFAAYAYRRHKSLLAPIAFHMAFNLSNFFYGTQFALSRLGPSNPAGFIAYLIVSAAAFAALGAYAFRLEAPKGGSSGPERGEPQERV
jgi:membrane protease YdiL (CAAX protease family)